MPASASRIGTLTRVSRGTSSSIRSQRPTNHSSRASCLHRKPVPILGTNVRLDTPEDVAAWIAERKRRWPTAARVAEKKRKLEEALANGGLLPDHLALMGGKRFRPFSSSSDADVTRMGRGRGRGGGRGRGFSGSRGRGRVHGIGAARGGINRSAETALPSRPPTVNDTVPPRPPSAVAPHLSSDDDDDDGAPEVVSAKRPPGIVAYGSSSDAEPEKSETVNDHPQPELTIPSILRSAGAGATAPADQLSTRAKTESVNCPRRAPPPQPKKPPRNPFAARSSLLRNVSGQHLLHYLASALFVLTVVPACL
jgi:Nuclear fragile X mental retardation-interacting protein 1 (NUFIP1)